MGIRMHLLVGYGLDLSEQSHLDRTKLNYSRIEGEELFNKWRSKVLDFAKRYDDVMEKMIFHENMDPPKSLTDMIAYDDEFGDKDRLVIYPAGSRKSFSRYGNLLDAFLFEAQQKDLSFDMTAEWLPHPGTLYPYVGLMKPNASEPLGVEKYWVPCYLNHPEHKDAIAWAPWHLYFLLQILFDLTDAETTQLFLALRPGIYRYWS